MKRCVVCGNNITNKNKSPNEAMCDDCYMEMLHYEEDKDTNKIVEDSI